MLDRIVLAAVVLAAFVWTGCAGEPRCACARSESCVAGRCVGPQDGGRSDAGSMEPVDAGPMEPVDAGPMEPVDAGGACGGGCALQHASSGCNGTACVVTSCETGWNDCDRLPADGCETMGECECTAASCGSTEYCSSTGFCCLRPSIAITSDDRSGTSCVDNGFPSSRRMVVEGCPRMRFALFARHQGAARSGCDWEVPWPGDRMTDSSGRAEWVERGDGVPAGAGCPLANLQLYGPYLFHAVFDDGESTPNAPVTFYDSRPEASCAPVNSCAASAAFCEPGPPSLR